MNEEQYQNKTIKILKESKAMQQTGGFIMNAKERINNLIDKLEHKGYGE